MSTMEKQSNETLEEEMLTSDGSNHELPEDEVQSDLSEEDDEIDEFLDLSNVREFVECPICLGIIQKTKAIKECLHRFCGECIEKSMRLCNHECPICRTHYAGQSSLKEDPNYDTLIASIYPRIEKYEEEELSLHEDGKKDDKKKVIHFQMLRTKKAFVALHAIMIWNY
ncbi:putative aminoacyltransferase, E1 ubiquitin-activating enzyme [Lupinus albus]|uniref:Putative aminoacyltransferase, E1 ubiquitin-activating enzyme n=1 Tax=Lupinus albus TaxID=3870 RepID=A0A6A4P3D3_LUPAL|nr:putative aminoacyltransferase, E1 ubiquitin-activating enzyme [Lupinus albus]